MDDQNKNLILATGLSFLVILIWFLLFPPAEVVPPPADLAAEATATASTAATADAAAGTAAAAEVAAEAPRIKIETPDLTGSISMAGGRIDSLSLNRYPQTLAEGSPNVELLTPVGKDNAYYALYGWTPAGELGFDAVPGPNTLWSVASGDTLAPGKPVTLTWDNGAGLVFSRQVAVDDHYLFTVTDQVQNNTGAEVRLAPYGLIARHGQPKTQNIWVLHEGIVQMSDGKLKETDYSDMPDFAVVEREGTPAEVVEVTTDGWIGFTDAYWMTVLAPKPGTPFTAVTKYVPTSDVYQTETRMPTMSVAPGAKAEVTSLLFSGAKEWETIRTYQNDQKIDRFIDSIDWGWFFFLTKPIFWLLHTLHNLIGNMGLAIIGLTLFLKALLFPLAYKSYVSMARMKELQPEMEALKERCGDDRQKLQQETMKLYKDKKVNPAAGCLPILPQIPIFFSLYKVIFVTIELRQAPFFGWIKDLSVPDPSSVLNLFGLLPYATPDPTSFLHVISLGVLPILLGISMWLQQRLNPAPPDPTQAAIFAWMPWIFMFMLGNFASGLVLYWIGNNMITFTQQYLIMRSHGHHPKVFGNIMESFRRKKPAAK
jgi:YidC/Oxa1 family membrane protein insertase